MLRTFALVLLALLIFASSAHAWGRFDKLDETASWLAMRDVHVHCLTPKEGEADPAISAWGASAYVEGWVDRHGAWHPYNYTTFAPGLCEQVMAVVRGDLTTFSIPDLAWAVLVITHESGHLRGHRWSAYEDKTQNWALRHFVPTAVHLGLDEATARSLLLPEAVKWHLSMPPEYRGPGCMKPKVVDGFLKGCKKWSS
jgi:hypothetical protein